MRQALLIALAALVTVTAVAFAQTQDNTYSVQGKLSPNRKVGPVGATFNYQVGESNGNRPAAVKTYKISFYGVKEHGERFRTCSASSIAAQKTDRGCKLGALVGTGKVISAVGPDNDVTSRPITCTKSLHIWNSGRHKTTLFLYGPASQCGGVGFVAPIPAKYRSGPGGGSTLVFTVPPSVLHPLTGLTTAVTSTTSKIKRLVNHGVGYYQAVRCKGHGRPVTVTFVSEAGQSTPISAPTGTCRNK
jgi:hypothetical protein